MSIGLFRGTVILEPHSIEWEANAQQTIAGLKAILGETITDAQHIGSTSIREICAKPIIDIAVGADDTEAVLSMNDKLEKKRFFIPWAGSSRTVSLHLR
ncbi:MAG: GrpB family protein [Ruminococcus flavefaciens]